LQRRKSLKKPLTDADRVSTVELFPPGESIFEISEVRSIGVPSHSLSIENLGEPSGLYECSS
jgi:hypothetical protein